MKEFKKQILMKLDDFSIKEESFDYIIEKINKMQIEDIFNHQNKVIQDIYGFLNEKNPYVYKSKNGYNRLEFNRVDVEKAIKYIKKSQECFYKGFSEKNLNLILLSLIIIDYFNFEIKEILDITLIDEQEKNIIKDKLINILESLEIGVELLEDAYYSDRKFMEIYKQGIKENNLQKIYEFINAIERGKGFYLPLIFRIAVEFLYILNPDEYYKILVNKEKPVEIIYFLLCLTQEQKLFLVNNYSLNDKFILFEILRESLKNNEKIDLEDEIINEISKCLEQLFNNYDDLYELLFNQFNNNDNFYKVFGTFLKNNPQYIDSYVEFIEFSKHNFHRKNYRQLYECFCSTSNESNIQKLSYEIYRKYRKYIKNLFNDDDFFLNEILIVNYVDFIFYHLCKKISTKEQFNEIIVNKIKKFDDLFNNWYKNKSQMQKDFFLYLTDIYLLSFVNLEKQYDINEDSLNLIDYFLKDKRYWLLFFNRTDMPEVYRKIIKNLGIE